MDTRGTAVGKGFTLVELIATVSIIALLALALGVFVPQVINWARQTSDKQTLTVLNDALNRYKTQGGGVAGLTAGAPIRNVIARLQSPVNWAGMTHRVLQSGKTYVGRSIDSTGDGANYRFTRYDTYTARFDGPSGVAVDGSGNIYVGDNLNHRIRKITPAGVVTTLAGSTQGYLDGTGAAARFSGPSGVAVDGSGSVYVADLYNHRIRKVTSAGVVTTLAGSTDGYLDGTGAAARFSWLQGVAVDSSGNVYVADTANHRIRKITPAGVVTTLAGGTGGYADGTGAAARFDSPGDVAVDSSGNIYVADSGNNRIRKITPAGVVTTLAGSTQGYLDGTGAAARFDWPGDVAVDSSGNIYVADSQNNRIRKITPQY